MEQIVNALEFLSKQYMLHELKYKITIIDEYIYLDMVKLCKEENIVKVLIDNESVIVSIKNDFATEICIYLPVENTSCKLQIFERIRDEHDGFGILYRMQ